MNKVDAGQQNTRDVEGYFYEGADGAQMAFWTCRSAATSQKHTHPFDEYMVCVAGEYTAYVGGVKTVLRPGDELFIPKGTEQWGKCVPGTRTIHAFGGRRIKRRSYVIRRAVPGEAARLTEVSFAAKRYWGYPEAYFAVWAAELTVTERYIAENIVFVAESAGNIAGFASIVRDPARNCFCLDHLFIRPEHIRRGAGSALFRHAAEYCRSNGIASFRILSDPHAAGFYEKMGAARLGETPSSIEGRNLPVFEYTVSPKEEP